MSCSLCRLPFTATPRSQNLRPLPPGTLTEKQYNYLQWGFVLGRNVPGGCLIMEYFQTGTFGNRPQIPLIINVAWESEAGTIVALHTVCATILREMFEATDLSFKSIIQLCLIEQVLGPTQRGPNAGRFKDFDYEAVGQDKVDTRPFWKLNAKTEMYEFDWATFKACGLDWTLSRPDVFPRFHSNVSPQRLVLAFDASTQESVLTRQPFDILHLLLPYFTNKSFVALLSTCRFFRYHALTTFQPQARTRVLGLGWAVPLPAEYAEACRSLLYKHEHKVAAATSIPMAHPEHSSMHGDWFLYLSQVHRMPALRARRRIWDLSAAIRREYTTRHACSEYADIRNADGTTVKSKARKYLEEFMGQMYMMTSLLNKS
ncbi:uncharacterized protein FIBRA_03460 [Fibroporia radiculosa]|uniref:F-box domain-containing protein n=1 Tax=Fibroporia radiculosa TaxID=599839 RepID=J4H2F0_9APHY|nr:uncharacterized protein FIBRA_03460 [Fibroporia radiculosa]CCM01409.1 predicted protein [Fibroporia radiculosa]